MVLATNVAETSLTVPGIKYVVDPGTARISRYSHRLKVQRLPIEPVSQASANQRKGRCGRVSEGVCIRLYSEEDFESRPEFTDPEILRTNLASVILQMTSLGLGDIAAFPFVEPPDRRNVGRRVDLLHELGAIDPAEKDPRKRLTPLGRSLAQLPVDPRLARMVLEADKNGCVREVLIIASALSIQDPRERPAEHQQAADERHRRFADPTSDFLAYLNLWNYLREQQRELSGSAFRRMCKNEFLHFLRVREWQDLHGQLKQVAKSLGVTLNTADAPPDRVHTSLLAGLLSHIGLIDAEKKEKQRRGQEYLGARREVRRVPGVVAVQEAAALGHVGGTGRDVPAVGADQRQDRARLDRAARPAPGEAQLQRAALVEEAGRRHGAREGHPLRGPDRRRPPRQLRPHRPRAVARAVHPARARRRRLGDPPPVLPRQPRPAGRGGGAGAPRPAPRHPRRRRETLFDFYDERIPEDVVSGRHFDSWWKKARHTDPDLLGFENSMLINETAGGVSEADYPDAWKQGPLRLRLTYQFEPGADADGVTVHVPVQVLNQVRPDGFEWQVPGLRTELVTELIRSLPKQLRVNFVPAPDYARKVLDRVAPRTEPSWTHWSAN